MNRECTKCGLFAKGKREINKLFGWKDAAHTKPQSQCKECRKKPKTKQKTLKNFKKKVTKKKAPKMKVFKPCPDGTSNAMVRLTESNLKAMLRAIKAAKAQEIGFNIKEV